jgi:hypothetical protein
MVTELGPYKSVENLAAKMQMAIKIFRKQHVNRRGLRPIPKTSVCSVTGANSHSTMDLHTYTCSTHVHVYYTRIRALHTCITHIYVYYAFESRASSVVERILQLDHTVWHRGNFLDVLIGLCVALLSIAIRPIVFHSSLVKSVL